MQAFYNILMWGDILGQETLNIQLFSILVVGYNDAVYINNILLWRVKPSVIVVAAVVVAVEVVAAVKPVTVVVVAVEVVAAIKPVTVVAAVEVEVMMDESNTANQFHNCNAYNSNIQA